MCIFVQLKAKILKSYSMDSLTYILIATGLSGILLAIWRMYWLKKLPAGTDATSQKTEQLKKGNTVTTRLMFTSLGITLLVFAVLMFIKGYYEDSNNGFLAFSYVMGAFIPILSSYLSMKGAYRALVEVKDASESSFVETFKKLYRYSSAVGVLSLSVNMVGLAFLFWFYDELIGETWDINTVLNVLTGFALGSVTTTFFLRISNSISNNANFRAKDITDKSDFAYRYMNEMHPLTNTRQSVWLYNKIVGAGSELFDTLSSATIAAMLVGSFFMNAVAVQSYYEFGTVLLPLAIAGAGILSTILVSFTHNFKENSNIVRTISYSEYISSGVMLLASFLLIQWLLPGEWEVPKDDKTVWVYNSMGVFWSTLVGLVAGLLLTELNEYFGGKNSQGASYIITESKTDAQSGLWAGLNTGYYTSVLGTAVIALATIAAYHFAGIYGIALAAVGMLSNSGMHLAANAFGAISSTLRNMGELDLSEESKNRLKEMDNAGQNMAALGRVFTNGSSALTAIALFTAFYFLSGFSGIDLTELHLLAGVVLGMTIPFLFTAGVMQASEKVASRIVGEVNRQFAVNSFLSNALEIVRTYMGAIDEATEAEKQVVADAEGKANDNKMTEVSVSNSLLAMIIPAGIAIVVPLIAALLGGEAMLGATVAGVIASGMVLAFSQTFTGNFWRSSKLALEDGIQSGDRTIGRESEEYRNISEGDSFGRPYMQMVSPALNVLIRFIALMALFFAPLLVQTGGSSTVNLTSETEWIVNDNTSTDDTERSPSDGSEDSTQPERIISGEKDEVEN